MRATAVAPAAITGAGYSGKKVLEKKEECRLTAGHREEELASPPQLMMACAVGQGAQYAAAGLKT
ncbi:MAG: hypothetical protein H6659_11690 [Ardenticatenaceae bacterium]|nr:hypothetical protein [Ardenticatenaceae bacterium]